MPLAPGGERGRYMGAVYKARDFRVRREPGGDQFRRRKQFVVNWKTSTMQFLVDILSSPWPWYVAGPAIGLFVPALLLTGNRMFGVSTNLRHLCAAILPCRVEYFRYDWKQMGFWNLLFLAGTALGGFLAAYWGDQPSVQISEQTRLALMNLGIHDFSGLAPREVFSWAALLTPKGFISVILGGFLVGFGTAYAGGCTSGHAISGLADLQLPSLIAVLGFFAGGLLATHFILPLVL